jgi:hypothetical protein
MTKEFDLSLPTDAGQLPYSALIESTNGTIKSGSLPPNVTISRVAAAAYRLAIPAGTDWCVNCQVRNSGLNAFSFIVTKSGSAIDIRPFKLSTGTFDETYDFTVSISELV